MLLSEVRIMLKQLLGFSRYRRVLEATLLVVFTACNPAETGAAGYLEVLPAGDRDASCDAAVPGHLQLDAMGDARGAFVSGGELCKSLVVHRELQAGLYSVSWQADADDDPSDGGEHWALRGPSLISIFPGQVTRLRIRQMTPDPELAAACL
jgi:hypothetical protein